MSLSTIRRAGYATLILLALTIAACAPKKDAGGSAKPITIGTVGPQSGDEAQIGQDMIRGVELAVDDLNAHGGILGRSVQLVKLDDRADPKEATSTASRLAASDEVIAVVGHLDSGCSIPASVIYHRAHMAMITPVSTQDDLTAQGFDEVFRVVLRNSDQGPAAARFAKEKLNAHRIAIVDDKSAYGRGIVAAFKREAVALGLDVVAQDSFNRGDKDFSTLVTKLIEAKPDVVYAGTMYTEGALLMQQARPRGLKATFVSGDGFFAPKLMELGGKAVEGTVVSFLAPPWLETPGAEDLLKRYRVRYGEEVKTYAPLAYDATMIIAEGIRRAGVADRAAVVKALHASTFSWNGVGGTYQFDKNGDITGKVPYFFVVRGGKFEAYR